MKSKIKLILAIGLLTSVTCNTMDIDRSNTPISDNNQEEQYNDSDNDNNENDADIDEYIAEENEGYNPEDDPFMSSMVDGLPLDLPAEEEPIYRATIGNVRLNISPENRYNAHASVCPETGNEYILLSHHNDNYTNYSLEVIENLQKQRKQHGRSFFTYFQDYDDQWAIEEFDTKSFENQIKENENAKNEHNQRTKLVYDQIKQDLAHMKITRYPQHGSYNDKHYKTYPSPIHQNAWHVVMSQNNRQYYFTYCHLDETHYLTPITQDLFHISLEPLRRKKDFVQAVKKSQLDQEEARKILRDAPQIIQQGMDARAAREKLTETNRI